MDFLKAVFDTAGIGGLLVGFIVTALLLCYGLTARWISKGYEEKTETP